jgi:hypothetical protein
MLLRRSRRVSSSAPCRVLCAPWRGRGRHMQRQRARDREKRNRKREPVLETELKHQLSLDRALIASSSSSTLSLSFSLLTSTLSVPTQNKNKRRRLHLGPPVRQGDAGLAGRAPAKRAPAGILQEGVPVSGFIINIFFAFFSFFPPCPLTLHAPAFPEPTNQPKTNTPACSSTASGPSSSSTARPRSSSRARSRGGARGASARTCS